MSRLLVAVATSVVVALTATACETPGTPGGGPDAGPQAKRTLPPETLPRITPRYPALLTHDAWLTSYHVVNNEGGIDFKQGRVRFRLTYKIETPNQFGVDGVLERAQADLRGWTRPRPFTVGTARGFVGEIRGDDLLTPFLDPGPYGPEWGDGTYRLHAIALATDGGTGARKRTVVMTLLTFTPRGEPLTAEHRATADRLIKSVVIDKRWSATEPRREITPVVPFSYARPPGLTGGEEIDVDGRLQVELTFRDDVAAGKGVTVEAERKESVRAARSLTRKTAGLEVGEADGIRAIPNLRAPGWVDDGVRVNWDASDEYRLRHGTWVFRLYTANPADFGRLRALISSLKLARQEQD